MGATIRVARRPSRLHLHSMNPISTCWSVIRGAAEGSQADKDEFARRYAPIIQAYLGARWAAGPRRVFVEDAVQDVFLECFRAGGALATADADRPGGFRAFLFGVAQNVALRFEEKSRKRDEREGHSLDRFGVAKVPASIESLSDVFDRAWAKAIVNEAASVHAARAARRDIESCRRADLLRLRFFEGLPIRDIAKLWSKDAASLHREYAKARAEFLEVLHEVVTFEHPGSRADIDQRCDEILEVLRRG